MRSVLDTIPIRVAPLPGEALDSWLDAYAHRLQVRVSDILDLAGIGRYSGRSAGRLFGRKPWVAEHYPDEFSALASITGVPVARLAQMTLTQYTGSLLAVDPDTGVLDHSGWARRIQPSRYCPHCLAENNGRWLLAWRLPWSFACLRHHCLLADDCPRCRRLPRMNWVKGLWPTPGFCRATRPNASSLSMRRKEQCLFPLAATKTPVLPEESPVLAAQQRVDRVIERVLNAHEREPLSLAERLQDLGDLHLSAQSALASLTTTRELPAQVAAVLTAFPADATLLPGPRNPSTVSLNSDVLAAAVGITIADQMLVRGPHEPDRDIARWLLTAGSNSQEMSPSSTLKRWQGTTTALQGALLKELDTHLRPSNRFIYRTGSSRPSRPTAAAASRTSKIPQLLWPGVALRLFPPTLARTGRTMLRFRSTASNLLAIAGRDDLSHRMARLLLSPDQDSLTPTPATTIARMRKAGILDLLSSVLGELSLNLDHHGSPIDYARRRQMFTHANLDTPALQHFFDRIGRPRPSAEQQVSLRLFLIEILTGTHPLYLPPSHRLSARNSHYEAALLRMPAPVMAFLHEQAQDLLTAAGIDEPVTWEPPDEWLPDVDWPGPSPDDIAIEDMWRLIEDNKPAKSIAEELGTTIEHVRVAARRHPLPHSPQRRFANTKVPRAGLPGPEELRRFRDEGVPRHRIAERYGCSETLIGKLFDDAGIPGLRPGRPKVHDIDPEWLRTEYEIRNRSTTSIAAEVGTHPNNLRRYLLKYGIPLRPRQTHNHPLAKHGGPSAFTTKVWNALAGQGGLQRVERFVAALEHQTFGQAARAVGASPSVLSQQFTTLERKVGSPLLQHMKNREKQRSLVPTPAGARFAEQARTALKLLN